jgi:exosortase family protein XrtF
MDSQKAFYWFMGKAIAILVLGSWLYYGYLMPNMIAQNWLTQLLTNNTAQVLKLFYKEVLVQNFSFGVYRLFVDGMPTIMIGYPCNGMSIFMAFTGFIIAYPGSWKLKLVFIPFGLLVIHGVNIIRIVMLSFNFLLYKQTFDVNHKYTFAFAVYSLVAVLWMWWANVWSKKGGFSELIGSSHQ